MVLRSFRWPSLSGWEERAYAEGADKIGREEAGDVEEIGKDGPLELESFKAIPLLWTEDCIDRSIRSVCDEFQGLDEG